MKQELIDLYDKAQDAEKTFIEYMLKGYPFMGAVGKSKEIIDQQDMLYSIYGNGTDVNLLRACIISADVTLNKEDSLLSSVFVFSLILLGRGWTTDIIKAKVSNVIDGAGSVVGKTEDKKILH